MIFINGIMVVIKLGVVKVDLVDMEGKYFEFYFEVNCVFGVDFLGVGILLCIGYLISLNDFGGSIKLLDEDGKYYDVNVRRRYDGLSVIDILLKWFIFWILMLIYDIFGYVLSNILFIVFNNSWIISDKFLDEL